MDSTIPSARPDREARGDGMDPAADPSGTRREPAAPGRYPSADQLLPPVEPPSARFLLQLFVIPAVIVGVAIALAMGLRWLVQRGAYDPQAIVESLRSSSQTRFQKANDLAEMLRMDEQYPQLKKNAELAAALGNMLDEMRTQEDDSDSAVKMRRILVGALGKFHVDAGLPALAATAASDRDSEIRGAAVSAIAALAQHFGELDPPQPLQHPELAETLIALANQPDDVLRGRTAFALGVMAATPGADERYAAELETMLEDLYPDARYDAATGLARTGDLRSAAVLIEMLDLEAIEESIAFASRRDDASAGDAPEGSASAGPSFNSIGPQGATPRASDAQLRAEQLRAAQRRAAKRDLIIVNALKGVDSLANRHPPDELRPLAAALEKLMLQNSQLDESDSLAPSLVRAAQQVLERLSKSS